MSSVRFHHSIPVYWQYHKQIELHMHVNHTWLLLLTTMVKENKMLRGLRSFRKEKEPEQECQCWTKSGESGTPNGFNSLLVFGRSSKHINTISYLLQNPGLLMLTIIYFHHCTLNFTGLKESTRGMWQHQSQI